MAELIDAERGGPDQRAAAEKARKADDTDAVAINAAADPKMLDRGGVRWSPSARRVWVGDHEIDLTRTEFDLLTTLMTAAGRILSREEIENKVWGDVSPKPNRLESQVNNLRNKLGEKGNDLIEWADSGYRFSLPTTPPVVPDKPRPTPWTQTSREVSRRQSREGDSTPQPDEAGLSDDSESGGDGPEYPIGTRPGEDGGDGFESPGDAPVAIVEESDFPFPARAQLWAAPLTEEAAKVIAELRRFAGWQAGAANSLIDRLRALGRWPVTEDWLTEYRDLMDARSEGPTLHRNSRLNAPVTDADFNIDVFGDNVPGDGAVWDPRERRWIGGLPTPASEIYEVTGARALDRFRVEGVTGDELQNKVLVSDGTVDGNRILRGTLAEQAVIDQKRRNLARGLEVGKWSALTPRRVVVVPATEANRNRILRDAFEQIARPGAFTVETWAHVAYQLFQAPQRLNGSDSVIRTFLAAVAAYRLGRVPAIPHDIDLRALTMNQQEFVRSLLLADSGGAADRLSRDSELERKTEHVDSYSHLDERADDLRTGSDKWRAYGGHAVDAISDQVRELLRLTEVGRRVLASLESMRVDERFVFMGEDRSVLGTWQSKYHAATVFTSGRDYVDQALTLAHESVHAEYFVRNRSVRDPLSMSRAEYVRAMVAEETVCFRRSMELAAELRSLGFEIPRAPSEDAYDAAYDRAVARRAKFGLTPARIHEQAHASAMRAAEQAVGSARWNDGRRDYRLHYREIWDRASVRKQYGQTRPSRADAVRAGQPRRYELTPAGAERMRQLVLRHDSDVVMERQLSRRLSEMAAEYGIAAGATSVIRAHVARDIATLDSELARVPERRPDLRRAQHKLRELSDLADELDKTEASIRSGRLKAMRDIVVADVVDRMTSNVAQAQRISGAAVLLPGAPARLVIVSEPGEHQIVLSDPRVAAAARGAQVEYCHVRVRSDGESYVWTTTRPVESPKPPRPTPLHLTETATRQRMERIRAELGSIAVGAWALDTLHDVEIVHTADPAAAGFKPVRRRLVLDIGMSDGQHMAQLVHHAIHVAVARDRETIEFVREQLSLSRESYIALRTAEETRAHAMEIIASIQLRNAGYAVPEPVGLRAYTEAYYRARAELVENMGLTGKMVPERFLPVLDRISNDAGLAALRPEVESHVVQGERYRDVYGKAWDAARGVRRFAEQVQAARASGERSVQFLHSGTTVPGVRKVELVTFDDDATYVRATLRDSHDAHAAVLSSRLGRAFGLPMPRIVADGHLVYCEPVSPALQAEFARADFGSVGLGLHDALTGSPDGNRVMADRSTQVAWSNQHHAFLATRLSSTTVSRFARRFLRVHADRTVEFIAHDVTAPELEWFRDRLLELRPEFERLGRGDWHDMMLDRFTRITEYARP
ncbi:winged helix-turn-helix domain-containing protein [Nocardia sp. N2S4-5]|uniref:winged helix-turn-helix domain-containing protein n=1 Tax=Nocardia sp. N2S4-5 TaxID=3351565 RepID=UPI0037D3F46D